MTSTTGLITTTQPPVNNLIKADAAGQVEQRVNGLGLNVEGLGRRGRWSEIGGQRPVVCSAPEETAEPSRRAVSALAGRVIARGGGKGFSREAAENAEEDGASVDW